jgi:hypothetical protein
LLSLNPKTKQITRLSASRFVEQYKPAKPADHGFVSSKEQVERCSERMMRQNEARYIAAERFNSPPLAPAWEF